MKLAVISFQHWSTAEINGLRPQHIEDCLAKGEDYEQFLSALTELCNLMLTGDLPEEIKPAFAGANLIALMKKDGGIRPIASGEYLRRLVSKCAATVTTKRHAESFLPHQLGCGTKGGAEAAAHAVRAFLKDASNGTLLLKVDFKNAFNSIRRDVIAEKLADKMPELTPFFILCFGNASFLFFGVFILDSVEGAQQGDPQAVFCFCLAINEMLLELISIFRSGYIIEITLGNKNRSCT